MFNSFRMELWIRMLPDTASHLNLITVTLHLKVHLDPWGQMYNYDKPQVYQPYLPIVTVVDYLPLEKGIQYIYPTTRRISHTFMMSETTLQVTNHITCMQSYCGWKKSCTTWDGRKPINNGINHLLPGAGFLPSTVC